MCHIHLCLHFWPLGDHRIDCTADSWVTASVLKKVKDERVEKEWERKKRENHNVRLILIGTASAPQPLAAVLGFQSCRGTMLQIPSFTKWPAVETKLFRLPYLHPSDGNMKKGKLLPTECGCRLWSLDEFLTQHTEALGAKSPSMETQEKKGLRRGLPSKPHPTTRVQWRAMFSITQ